MSNGVTTICFGQQPCGFFPKNFLIAKISSAKNLQKELGGPGAAKIVFFYHDSDADYRETITVMKDRSSGAEVRLNFTQENKLQKKHSPLYAKRIPNGWKAEILKQLPRFMDRPLIDLFNSADAPTVADFCLEMYKKMGILDGIEVVRSGDRAFREKAPELTDDFFADVDYQGEIVRARIESSTTPTPPSPFGRHFPLSGEEAPRLSVDNLRNSPPLQAGVPPSGDEVAGALTGVLHEGGDKFIRFPILEPIQKFQKNPGADQRFGWMNSVIGCSHYIYGAGEGQYLKFEDFPEVKFVEREKVENSDYAYLG